MGLPGPIVGGLAHRRKATPQIARCQRAIPLKDNLRNEEIVPKGCPIEIFEGGHLGGPSHFLERAPFLVV